jgi:NitT/TauT family transport system substrate-binding protein
MKRKLTRSALLLATLGALASLAPAAFAQEKLKLAVGQRGNWDTAIPELGMQKGIFQKHGLDLEVLYTQGSGETVQAVISGSVDIGLAAGLTGVMAAFEKGAPVRPISNSMTGADDLYWYVPANSPIKTIKDAGGKTISYSTRGSSTHVAVLGFIDYYKVDMKPTAVGGPSASFAQTMSGQVDIGWSSAPLQLKDLKEGRIRMLVRESEVPKFQNMTVRVNISNLDVINKRSAALNKFYAAYAETVEWMYSDPDAIKRWSEWTQTPLDIAQGMRDEYFPKKNLLLERLSGVEDAMNDGVEMKLLQKPLSKEQMADLFKSYYKK